MKFVRIRTDKPDSRILPCIVDSKGNARDISSLMQDISAAELYTKLGEWHQIKIEELPIIGLVHQLSISSCIPIPKQFIGIAFNSKERAQQMDVPCADEPVFFIKSVSSICGPNDPLIYPKIAKKVDWEAELGVIIGKKGKYIPIEKALDYVLGYCCSNDFSDRHWQCEHPGAQHVKGKSFETFAPLGPFLVTKEEIPDPNNLNIILKVNGEIRQQFSTRDYLFTVQEVISFLSQFFPLEPGDIITMGSGPGSAGMWNDQYLKVGDKIEFEIECLGRQERLVVKE